MTVAELIEQLQRFNGTERVVMSADDEGNYFHNLFEIASGRTREDETEPVFDEEAYDPDELDYVVVLWP